MSVKVNINVGDGDFSELSGDFEFDACPRIGETIEIADYGHEFFDDGFSLNVKHVYHKAGGGIGISAEHDYGPGWVNDESIACLKKIGFSKVIMHRDYLAKSATAEG